MFEISLFWSKTVSGVVSYVEMVADLVIFIWQEIASC